MQRENLVQSQDDLQKAVQSEKEQEPKRDDYLAMRRRARNLEEEADFDEALKTYDEILNKFGERAEDRKDRGQAEARLGDQERRPPPSPGLRLWRVVESAVSG